MSWNEPGASLRLWFMRISWYLFSHTTHTTEWVNLIKKKGQRIQFMPWAYMVQAHPYCYRQVSGCCSHYHTGSLHFPELFPGTQFRPGWVGSPGYIVRVCLVAQLNWRLLGWRVSVQWNVRQIFHFMWTRRSSTGAATLSIYKVWLIF